MLLQQPLQTRKPPKRTPNAHLLSSAKQKRLSQGLLAAAAALLGVTVGN
jgi:hypothetical protein